MQVQIGKRYKIVGEVSEHHGDCQGDILTCTFLYENGDAVFDPLEWSNFSEKGDYILCPPDNLPVLEGEDYFNWLATVLEEV